MVASDPTDLDRLLDGLVTGLDRARHAVALSTDGMLLGRSGQLDADDAGHLSAVASAFQSLADGAGAQFGGGAVRQTVVELDRATLFVAAAGEGACLALLADEGVDMGRVAYGMNRTVERIGPVLATLATGPRHTTS